MQVPGIGQLPYILSGYTPIYVCRCKDLTVFSLVAEGDERKNKFCRNNPRPAKMMAASLALDRMTFIYFLELTFVLT